jgi:hypothetical protein
VLSNVVSLSLFAMLATALLVGLKRPASKWRGSRITADCRNPRPECGSGDKFKFRTPTGAEAIAAAMLTVPSGGGFSADSSI